ncbi:hypothetical protein BDU57DRAFT_301351 [Ampelomyces quisqualis]|uniref:AMP-activated protein kinase glycogen-binding domain-containing protein n=1 Tax=Ampelomyces quisqualis TaxID=50730 RepID=A0A6A5QIN2_AMPQU|nr:hypothetical protein BDU57DRAFT_301351 [Ampelomyces quisqualis]
MDNTTLHTFLFHCPVALHSLVLLGSWDNFSRPYPLELDARQGRDNWRGCFTFSDIICDGDFEDLLTRRNGPLKMGGTYWYYYKVDGDDECHNPSEPSTTLCPLLPGQRLNVLEIPSERHNCSTSSPSDGFTRDPSDRYLNPVPPAPLSLRPLPSPRSGTASQASSPLPLPSPWAPKSATYPPPDAFLSPNVVQHARSASASPRMPSTPLFADFRGLKDRLASKRSSSRSRSGSKSQELEIGAPVLISTTTKDLNLIPLASYRPAPTFVPCPAAPIVTSATRSVPAMRKKFSPLGSHPFDPVRDAVFAREDHVLERKASLKRRRSHVPSMIITSEFESGHNRIRANSTDTRRTQHYLFSNDPWLSTPTHPQTFELDAQEPSGRRQPTPARRSPSGSLALLVADERPTSSHGSKQSSSFLDTSLDKDLPELPRYLKPAPLFACSNLSTIEPLVAELPSEEELEEDQDDKVLGDLMMEYEDKPNSHFSTWSCESMAYTYSTSDDEAEDSPTFSSLTSTCSDAGSPQRLSIRYSCFDSKTEEVFPLLDDSITTPNSQPTTDYLSSALDDLRISTFSSDLFNLDIQHADSAPRRQAACFGLGFQYSLPEDETTSKTTIKESTLRPEPSVQRESSVSQLNGLIYDFAYLGDAVI